MSRQKRIDGAAGGVSRRALVQAGVGLAGGSMLSTFSMPLFAADHPPVGTYPAGSSGARYSSASRCHAPAPMRCRAKTSSRAGSSRSSTSIPAMS